MPKFMFTGQYSAGGLKGSLEEGFAAREATVTKMIESMGGTVEGFYWTYGKNDIVTIIEGTQEMALAIALAVSSDPDSVQIETMPLLTAADLDAALAKLPQYRGPGD
jgi:uncharacterized protein with GYD domain